MKTLEDLVDLLQRKPNPMELAAQLPSITESLTDLRDRLANLEHNSLESKFRLDQIAHDRVGTAQRLSTIENERVQDRKRIDAVEKAPDAHKEDLLQINKRVRTLEGAIGSSNYQASTSLGVSATNAPDKKWNDITHVDKRPDPTDKNPAADLPKPFSPDAAKPPRPFVPGEPADIHPPVPNPPAEPAHP